MLVSVCEFVLEARESIEVKGWPFWKALLREFRAAVRTTGNTKPVKRRAGSSAPPSESKL